MSVFLITFGLVMAAGVWLVVRHVRNDAARLRAAKAGAVRVESVKPYYVEQTVRRYAEHGWAVQGQPTTAKSFLSAGLVTLTFRKQ